MRAIFLFSLTWLAIVPAYSASSIIDLATLNCLVGDKLDQNPQYCAVLDPDLGAQADRAHKIWIKRNSVALREMKEACDERILRAYANNQAEILLAKERAKQFQERQLKAWKANPNPNSINCRAYIEDHSKGGGKQDELETYIFEIRNSKAAPVDWSSPFFDRR